MRQAQSLLKRAALASTLLLAIPSIAEEIPTGAPDQAGMSAERLQRITEHMNDAVAQGTMVGGQGMIARDGRVVYNQAYGQLDREKGVSMPEDAIYRIYSMTKPITAVALMMLYEEGRFHLNDPLAMYLPELANLKVAASTANATAAGASDGTTSTGGDAGDASKEGEVFSPARQPTVRDLLRHTAGMTYGLFGNTEVDKLYREAEIWAATDIKTFVERLGTVPLQYEPGTRWHYSVAVDVQGRLVEVLSGQSFGEFLQERIFEPLDMPDTSFVLPTDKLDRLAQLYSPEGTSAGRDDPWQRSASTTLVVAVASLSSGYLKGDRFESGGGGLLSTSRDYMRFCQMLIQGGELDGVRLLSPKTINLMSRDHLGDIPGLWRARGDGFGLGFAVSLDRGAIGEIGTDGTYSWGGAAGTRFWIDPKENMVGIFMVQSIPHQTRLRNEFMQLMYQAVTTSYVEK